MTKSGAKLDAEKVTAQWPTCPAAVCARFGLEKNDCEATLGLYVVPSFDVPEGFEGTNLPKPKLDLEATQKMQEALEATNQSSDDWTRRPGVRRRGRRRRNAPRRGVTTTTVAFVVKRCDDDDDGRRTTSSEAATATTTEEDTHRRMMTTTDGTRRNATMTTTTTTKTIAATKGLQNVEENDVTTTNTTDTRIDTTTAKSSSSSRRNRYDDDDDDDEDDRRGYSPKNVTTMITIEETSVGPHRIVSTGATRMMIDTTTEENLLRSRVDTKRPRKTARRRKTFILQDESPRRRIRPRRQPTTI